MITVTRIFEYDITCDKCGNNEILHTGDSDGEIKVHDIQSAIKHAKFHKNKGIILCNKCFKKLQNKSNWNKYKTI